MLIMLVDFIFKGWFLREGPICPTATSEPIVHMSWRHRLVLELYATPKCHLCAYLHLLLLKVSYVFHLTSNSLFSHYFCFPRKDGTVLWIAEETEEGAPGWANRIGLERKARKKV